MIANFPSEDVILFEGNINLELLTDQSLPLLAQYASYWLTRVRIWGTNGAIATANGGLYNGTGKPAGGILITPAVMSTITGGTVAQQPALTPLGNAPMTAQTLYWSQTIAEGAAPGRTGKITIWGTPIS